MKRPSLFTLSVFVSFFSASAAHAAESAPSEPAPSDAHLRGLEVAVRPTLGSAGTASPLTAAGSGDDAPAVLRSGSAPYGLAAGAGLQLGFRFHPLVSAGLRGDLASVSANAPNDGTRDLSRTTQSAGLYARIYPLALSEDLRRHVDPWIGAGVTYVHDGQSFQRTERTNRGELDATWKVDSHAIGIPIGIGLDYRVTQWLSAGPSFEYVVMNPVAGCVKVGVANVEQRVCTDDASGKDGLVASSAGAWNAGLMLRVTPF